MKKQKSETLGYFIECASDLIKKSQSSSLRGSMAGSLQDNLVSYSTPKVIHGRNSQPINLEEKYESWHTMNAIGTKKNLILNSFDSPIKRSKKYHSRGVTFIENSAEKTILRSWEHKGNTSLKSRKTQIPLKISIDWILPKNEKSGDADDLIEFIELEDFCRRNTTVSESKEIIPPFKLQNVTEASLKREVNNRTSNKMSKRSKKGNKRTKRIRGSTDTSNLAKKMAITISKDKIIYW